MLTTTERNVPLVEPPAQPAIPPPVAGMTEIDLDDETGGLETLQPSHVNPTERNVRLVEPPPPPKCHGAIGCLQKSYCAKQGHCRWNPTDKVHSMDTAPRTELRQ